MLQSGANEGRRKTAVFVIMGVSGSGKTTVGQALAKNLAAPFYDGDAFHPPENVGKMVSGQPLDDADRLPWLARLHDLIIDHLAREETAVLACSALKQKYRDLLRGDGANICFIFLEGSFDLIWQRMENRKNHYMKADMLQSQFDALDPPPPTEALIISIDQTPKQILKQIMAALKR